MYIETSGNLGALDFAATMAFMVISIALAIFFYFLTAIALMKIGKNRGHDESWISFVPILNTFYIPYLIKDQVGMFRGNYMIVYVASFLLSIIPLLGIIFALINIFLTFYSFFILYRDYTENYVLYIVITALTFGIALPFLLFRIRNREPKFITSQ